MYRYVLIAVSCLLTTMLSVAQPLAAPDEGKHRSPRMLRYTPDGEDFVITNGNRKFNRALYGSPSTFRLETSDVPEFALYLPRMGGNLSFSILRDQDTLSLNQAANIESRYRPGSRIYTIQDPALGTGVLQITALALSDADGAIWKITSQNTPSNIRLLWRFGGASDKRFSREGDMGVDPANCFDFSPSNCVGNTYTIKDNVALLTFAQNSKTGIRILYGEFPDKAQLWTDNCPALYGSVYLDNTEQYMLITLKPYSQTTNLPDQFANAESARAKLAGRIRITTPDPYLNTVGGALAVAADGIWDGEVWLHGAVGWRMPLSGWRAAYTADALGWHDRARIHFDAYAESQVTHVPNTIPHPVQDPEANLARSKKEWGTPHYSNGYICRNPYRNDQMHHYDMNLCYIDELLWHFNWTGDLDYARKMWPLLTRHLAWEKRNFDPNDDGLYDAYACIWASDALFYNSGAVTYSSAYNYRANKMAAEIAVKIGENPESYLAEARKILAAINSNLWLPDKGHWAEYQDFMGKRRLHESAAIWSIYHAIDSDIANPFQAYQATRYVDTQIPHIPVKADGLPDEGYETISTTNWMPYSWSINNVAFAEVMHMALAYFQAGRSETGYKLLKSSILDGMYLGGSPGNFGQVSFYDAARGECYRDFGDPIGVASRVLIQGLFGIRPDALNNRLVIRPGLPRDWGYAQLETPDLSFDYQQSESSDLYRIVQHFQSPLALELQIPARKDKISGITVNGNKVSWKLSDAIAGYPLISIELPMLDSYNIKINWEGDMLDTNAQDQNKNQYNRQDTITVFFPKGEIITIHDPQRIFSKANISSSKHEIKARITGNSGYYTVFAELRQGDMHWWQPIHIQVKHPQIKQEFPFTHVISDHCEPIQIDHLFNSAVTDIFQNRYLSPRSPYTTLQLPTQGIGEWCHPLTTAGIDDSGLRSQVRDNIFHTPLRVPFRTPSSGKNIAFTSLWDNYPDSLTIPLSGKASSVYLLLAGSTNHMQCRIANGVIRVHYTDGTIEELKLVNPENWCPIEQDFFADDIAFSLNAPRPYRLHFKSGLVSNNLEKELNITGVYGRSIKGGAGILLDMKLNPQKKLKDLTIETLSNDVIIGIMGITLQR